MADQVGGDAGSRTRPVHWRDDGCGDESLERLAYETIGAAIEVHRIVGPGMPEGVYEAALSHELSLRQIPHERQVPLPVVYKGLQVGEGRLDLLVDSRLVVELKSCEQLHDVHRAQVRAYLCATGFLLGLLINFNVAVLQDGIKRVINSK
jgi:GxxExxY protein